MKKVTTQTKTAKSQLKPNWNQNNILRNCHFMSLTLLPFRWQDRNKTNEDYRRRWRWYFVLSSGVNAYTNKKINKQSMHRRAQFAMSKSKSFPERRNFPFFFLVLKFSVIWKRELRDTIDEFLREKWFLFGQNFTFFSINLSTGALFLATWKKEEIDDERNVRNERK